MLDTRTRNTRTRGQGEGRYKSITNPSQNLVSQVQALNPYAWYSAEHGQPKNVGYAQLGTTTTDVATFPDGINVDITGDLWMWVDIAADDWTPTSSSLVWNKGTGGPADQCYGLQVASTGALVFITSDGTATTTSISTATIAAANGSRLAVGVDYDADNGAGSNVVTFYTSTDGGNSWTQLGAAVTTANPRNIQNGTLPITLGAGSSAVQSFAGKYYKAQIWDGRKDAVNAQLVAEFDASKCYVEGYVSETLDYGSGQSKYVPLTGRSSDFVYTLDNSVLDVTGDIEILWRGSIANLSTGSEQCLVSKYYTTGNNRSFRFGISGGGNLIFVVSTDGINVLSFATATAALSTVMTAGQPGWLRVTRSASTGQNNFYWAADSVDIPTSWTAIGTTVGGISEAGTIYNSAAQLELGSFNVGGTSPTKCNVYRAIVRNGINGTIVANFNASNSTPYGYISSTNNLLWTVQVPKLRANWTLTLPKIYDRSSNNRAPLTFATGTNKPRHIPWTGVSRVTFRGQNGSISKSGSMGLVDTVEVIFKQRVGGLHPWQTAGSLSLVANNAGFNLLKWTDGGIYFQTTQVTNGFQQIYTGGVPTGEHTQFAKYPYLRFVGYSNFTGNIIAAYWYGSYDGASWVLITPGYSGALGGVFVSGDTLISSGAATGDIGWDLEAFWVRNAVGGPNVATFDASKLGQASGDGWTVTRDVSGEKFVVNSPVAFSARSKVLLATDDYMTVPLAAIPSMDTADDYSYILVERQWGNTVSNPRLFDTRNTGAVSGVVIRNDTATSLDFLGFNAAGAVAFDTAGVTITYGSRNVIAGIKQSATATVTVNETTSASAAVAAGNVSSVVNGNIGRQGYTDSLYWDGEFEELLTFNRALSASESQALSNMFMAGV